MSGILSRSKTGSAGAVGSGAQTQTGDALNIGASAGDDLFVSLNQSYHTVATDHGAVSGAFNFGSEALDFASEIGDSAIFATRDIASRAISETSYLADAAIYSNERITSGALSTVLDSNRMAQQTVLQALDYNQALIAEGNQTEATTIFRQILDALPIVLAIGGVVYVISKKG